MLPGRDVREVATRLRAMVLPSPCGPLERAAAEVSFARLPVLVSGAGCPPEFQLDAGSKFQGRSSRMRDCGWPAAIFSSVFVSQA